MKRIGSHTYIDGNLDIEGRFKGRVPDGGLSQFDIISRVMNLNMNAEFVGGRRVSELAVKANNETITGNYTFSSAPSISTPSTAPNAAVRYDQLGNYVKGAGNGLAGRLAYWNTNNEISQTQMIYDPVNSRLGVNQGAPMYTLDVQGDMNTSALLRINGNAGSGGQFLKSGGASQAWSNITEADVTGLTASLAGKQASLTGPGLVKAVGGVISYITDNSVNWDAAYSASAGFVRKATADVITAAHDFTNQGLSLPDTYGQNLSGNVGYVHYFKGANNGANNSYAHHRVWDGPGNTIKELVFGGDGSLTWDGTNISLQGHTHTFASLTSKPTNVSGYGITDILAQTLAGYVSGSNTAIGSGNSILTAFQNIQSQISALGISSHAAVTLGTTNGLSLLGQALSLQAATASVPGALLAADFVTFRDRLSGSLTSGYLPKATGSHATADSVISESGGNIAIGSTLYSEKLNIGGSLDMSNSNVPTGMVSELGGVNYPVFVLHANFRGSRVNTTYRGAAVRLDMRDGLPPFSWYYRESGSGTENMIARLYGDGEFYASRYASTVPNGTAPLTVDSSTMVNNMNVQYLNGQPGSYYLDWNYFTSKPTILTGSATATRLAYWTSATNLASTNLVHDSGTGFFGINNGSPMYQLDVNGDVNINGAFRVSWSAGSNGQVLSSTGTGVSWRTIASGDVTGALGFTPISGIDSGMVIAALGYTPYNSTNPSNFISRGGISGAGAINYDAGTGIISYTGGAGSGTVAGTGTDGYFMQWSGGGVNASNSTVRDTGSEINFSSARDFGVESHAAFRKELHVHEYLSVGKTGYHGSILVHDNSSGGGIHSTLAFEIRSATKGSSPFPSMTYAQRVAISSPTAPLFVYQTDATPGGGGSGVKMHVGAGLWFGLQITTA